AGRARRRRAARGLGRRPGPFARYVLVLPTRKRVKSDHKSPLPLRERKSNDDCTACFSSSGLKSKAQPWSDRPGEAVRRLDHEKTNGCAFLQAFSSGLKSKAQP